MLSTIMLIKPVPVPRTGMVKKLKLNIAQGQAEVFIHQTQWPRQSQNPNWRIEVTKIDGRHDESTRALIRSACEETARIYLARWLKEKAPLLSLESVSWQELVKFATMRSFRVLSPHQVRRMRGRGTKKLPIRSEIEVDIDRLCSSEEE